MCRFIFRPLVGVFEDSRGKRDIFAHPVFTEYFDILDAVTALSAVNIHLGGREFDFSCKLEIDGDRPAAEETVVPGNDPFFRVTVGETCKSGIGIFSGALFFKVVTCDFECRSLQQTC